MGMANRAASKLPPMAIGFAKSATDLIKTNKKELAIPGATSGKVTRRKVAQRDAPRSRAASSIEGSMDFSIPTSSKYAMGKNDKVCTRISPLSP